jgi:hypothetical protein
MVEQMRLDKVIGAYAIGGAVAATFYIEPISTVYVDIFVVLPTIPGTQILSLSGIYDYLLARGCPMQDEYIIVGHWPIQFLAATTELELEALSNAVDAEADGVKTRVMSAEHLVAICLQTGRFKDYDRIERFLEHDAVDIPKLEDILKRHRLLDKWKAFQQNKYR